MQQKRRLYPIVLSALAGTASLGRSTILGSRIVKVEPRPGSLSTVMSPPIIWQKRLLIARPRPVPPYLLAVVGGSLGKLLEQLAHLLRRHADAGVGNRQRDPVAAVLLSLVERRW